MMQHPDLVMMIHESMVQEEQRKAALPHPVDQPGPLSTLRAVTGNALIALGTRIAPASRRRSVTGSLTLPAPARAS
jgi:hypothetical protein